jgi:hypothetical protein
MIRNMRRVLVAAIVLVAVSFGVGWVASSSDERTGVRHPPAVAHLKPLPVPRVVIPNGPWADPHPPLAVPARVAPRIQRSLLAEFFFVLGIDLETGAILVR